MNINQGFKAFTGGLLALGLLVSVLPAQAADFTVDQNDNDCGDLICDLVSAIETANTNGEEDSIDLNGNTILLTVPYANGGDMDSGLPTIGSDNGGGGGTDKSLITIKNGTIKRAKCQDGSDASDCSSAGGNTGAFRLLAVNFDARLTLDHIALTGGQVSSGGALYVNGASSVINIIQSSISKNSATGGNYGGYGGAVYVANGKVAFSNSALSDNTVATAYGDKLGGGVYVSGGTVSFINSTLSGNAGVAGGPQSGGGGIYVHGGSASFINSTVSNNDAIYGGGIAVYGSAKVSLLNTVIAEQTAGSDCYATVGGTLISLGHNLDSDNSCSLNASGDVSNTNPQLGPLTDNGGPTHTHALCTASSVPDAACTGASPALDAGDETRCPTTDQRGEPRRGLSCDIGAFEATPASVLTVNSLADPGDGTCDATECTLREAVTAANADADSSQIEFATGLTGTIPLSNGYLPVTAPLAVNGPGRDLLVIDAQNNSRIFGDRSPGTASYTLRGLTVTRGNGGGGSSTRGGALAGWTGTTLRLNDVLVSDSRTDRGGGVYTDGDAWLLNSLVRGNFASISGGGIDVGGTLYLINSGLVANTAESATTVGGSGGGGRAATLYASNCLIQDNQALGNSSGGGDSGGFSPGIAEMTGCTLRGNRATDKGGALTFLLGGTSTIRNSTFVDNEADGAGGVLFLSASSLNIVQCTLSNNDAGNLAVAALPSGGSLIFDRSLLAGNSSGCSGNVSATHTLSSGEGGCGATTATTLAALNLGPLGDYGGPTPTIPLLRSSDPSGNGMDSAALDAVGCLSDINKDQRGVSRPQGGNCDIGAFEREASGTLAIDFGDAPDASVSTSNPKGYPVTIADSGAGHLLGGPALGVTDPDAEADGQPNEAADLDGAAEEDGLGTPVNLTVGNSGSIPVTATGGYLSAWLDINRDGDWDDDGEQLANGLDMSGGSATLTPDLFTASAGATYLRLRVCSVAAQCNTPRDVAADGEVEDHLVELESGSVDFGSVVTGDSNEQTYTITNNTDSAVTLEGFMVSGAGYSFSTDCGATLAAGDSCEVTITYNPTQSGTDSGTLSYTANGVAQTVALSGVAIDALVTLSLSGSPFDEDGGVATVTAMLSDASTQDVTVSLGFAGSATNGTDYTPSGTQIVIPAGALTASIDLLGNDDDLFEGNETVIVSITSVTNATENDEQSVTAEITEDDSLPEITLKKASGGVTSAKVGNKNVVMLAVDVKIPTYPEALNVSSLDLTAGGSGHDQRDVSKVQLWLDDGDGKFSASKDTALASGSYSKDNGTLKLTKDVSLAAGKTHRLFVTYDFGSSLAALALPMMAGLPLLAGLGLIGFGGQRRRALALCLILLSPIALTGCPGAPEGAAAYVAYKEITDDDDDDDAVQTETFRVAPSAVTASFPSVEKPTVTGLPIVGDTVTVSE